MNEFHQLWWKKTGFIRKDNSTLLIFTLQSRQFGAGEGAAWGDGVSKGWSSS